MDETTLFRAWRRRIVTRGSLVVLLTTIPVVMAGLISVGGGGSLLPEGFGSLTSGPSPEAAGIDLPAGGGSRSDGATGLVALTVAGGAQSPRTSQAAGPGTNGTGTVPAAGGAPSGTVTPGSGEPGGGSGGGGSGSGGPVTTPSGPGTGIPGSSPGGLSQTLDQVGNAVNNLLKPK